MLELILPNLLEILAIILTGIVTYFGAKIKAVYEEKVNDDTKRKVVSTVVRAIEQLYKDLNGEEKLEKAKEAILEMLNEKGITITELEMNMLIEEVCNSFKESVVGE